MIDGIEPLYQQIAESIVNAISEEWIIAKFDVIFYPQSSIYEAEFVGKNGVPKSFQPTNRGNRAFREIRKKFKLTGKPLWGQACFELQSNGNFNMKWGYENCDENGNTRFDADAEVKRHEDRVKRLNAVRTI